MTALINPNSVFDGLFSQSSKRNDIANLQPDTVVTIFHGTSQEVALKMCENGIDGNEPVGRIQQHDLELNGKINWYFSGLFVTSTVETASKFGHYVIKFKTLAKNLHYQYESIHDSFKQLSEEDYPNSFNPQVSWDLLNEGSEPQALFKGFVSPRSIEKVYDFFRHKTYSRDEFVLEHKKKIDKPLIEPQENITYDEYVKRLSDEHGISQSELKDIFYFHFRDFSVDEIFSSIKGISGGFGEMPYSVAKSLAPQIYEVVQKKKTEKNDNTN